MQAVNITARDSNPFQDETYSTNSTPIAPFSLASQKISACTDGEPLIGGSDSKGDD